MQIVELGDCSMAISLDKTFPEEVFRKFADRRRIKVDKVENLPKYKNGVYLVRCAREFIISGGIMVLYFDEGMPEGLAVGDSVFLFTHGKTFLYK